MKKTVSTLLIIFFLFLCSCNDGGDSGTLITPDGGTAVSDDGLFAVTFPPEAVGEDIFVSIIPLDSSTVPSKPDSEFVGSVYVIVARNGQGEPADIFYKNTEITV
ncbi:MAG: hypothetical protein GY795_25140, partial [Desulfobacterales bacterium]|nr:hypothetical protein [Desulfobacterales bacterium]